MEYNSTNKTYKLQLGESNNDVIIGNEVVSDKFEADIKLTCWNKENALSFAFEGVNGTPTKNGEKLTLANIKLYKENDEFKWIWLLKEKPTDNKLVLKIVGWEDYNFTYKEPWVNYEPITDRKDWIRKTDNPKMGLCREIRCNGSYAIHHKTKQVLGLSNAFSKYYRDGKFGHIYRPRFIDTDGKKFWGDLHIENGVYTVTVPDGIKYPIRSNDTFGLESVGNDAWEMYAGYLWVCGYALGDDNAEVSKLTARLQSNGSRRNIKGVIYSDDSGPAALQGVTAAASIATDEAWYDLTFGTAIELDSGTYWLGTVPETSTIFIDELTTGSTGFTVKRTEDLDPGGYDDPFSFADPWPGDGASHANDRNSIYATYEIGGAEEAAATGFMTTNSKFW